MKKIAIFLLFSICSVANGSESTISPNKLVTRISTYETAAVVFFSPTQANNQNCSDPRQDAVKIDLTVEGGKGMLSTILAAAAAHKEVGFGLNGNLPKVYRVDVLL